MPRVWNKREKGIPADAVYVGRPSKWGNRYNIHKNCPRELAIKMFREFQLPSLRAEAVRELRGKDLVCWCAPLACHADVLLEIANLAVDESRTLNETFFEVMK